MSWVWALPLVIALPARSASVSPRPVAWAAQSPRPASCLVAPGLWEVSRQAQVEARCHELARAQALLQRAPELALARATALLARDPSLREAKLLRGRANLRLGNTQPALADLLLLLEGSASGGAEPAALQDGGRAALAQRDLPNAVRFYERLGSGAALLGERREQVVAYIEIAATLLASQPTPGEETLAYLREARRRSAGSGFSDLVLALTGFAWSLQGREAEGQGAFSEIKDPARLASFEKRREVWLPDGLLAKLQSKLSGRPRGQARR